MGRKKDKKSSGGSKGQNRKTTDDYLTKFKNRDGVQCSSTGLLYEVLREGSSGIVTLSSSVVVNQRTMLIGGKMLQDSYKEGTPYEYCVDEVVEGLKEGLQLMREGSRYKFVVPPELAWGRKGSGGRIGPDAVIIFDVSLITIK